MSRPIDSADRPLWVGRSRSPPAAIGHKRPFGLAILKSNSQFSDAVAARRGARAYAAPLGRLSAERKGLPFFLINASRSELGSQLVIASVFLVRLANFEDDALGKWLTDDLDAERQALV